MQSPATNLTGIWQGLYTYSDGASVSFTAVLIETGNSLSGSTHEACSVPGCPLATHDAFLRGMRHGQAVTFTKTYEPMGNGYATAQYEGTLNADGSEIEGRWTLPVFGSGKFLMIRSPGAKETVSEKKFERA
jgi:hypothetical protein